MPSAAQVIHKYWCMYGLWLKNTHPHQPHFILAPCFWITVHEWITVLLWRWARTGCTNWSHRRWYNAQCYIWWHQYLQPIYVAFTTGAMNTGKKPCLGGSSSSLSCLLLATQLTTHESSWGNTKDNLVSSTPAATPHCQQGAFFLQNRAALPPSSQSHKRHTSVLASSAAKHTSSTERQ